MEKKMPYEFKIVLAKKVRGREEKRNTYFVIKNREK